MTFMKGGRLISYNGRTQRLCEWAREYGMSDRVLRKRYDEYQWSFEKALTTPLGAYQGKRGPDRGQRGAHDEPWQFQRLVRYFPKVAHLAPKVMT